MYKERLTNLKNELLALNTLSNLVLKEVNAKLENENKETVVKNSNYVFIVPSLLSVGVFLVTDSNYLKYGSLLGLNLLSAFVYLKYNKSKQQDSNNFLDGDLPDTSYFPKKMFSIYDAIADKWNTEIKLIGEEMINYYISEEMDILVQLEIKAKIYDYVFFSNEKSDVLNEYYNLKNDHDYSEKFNNLVYNNSIKLNMQIEKICQEQLNIYSKLDSNI